VRSPRVGSDVPVISARNLSKAYGAEALLSGISLTIKSGERVGLLGANGAGKSTLLRILSGLETADAGVVETRRDARVLYLPQEPRLQANTTPRAIVEAGLWQWQSAVARHSAITQTLDSASGNEQLLHEQASLAETIERLGGWTRGHVVEHVLHELGVHALDQTIDTMSGGEQRRVALARVLVSEPTLAILDEPTNHLDADAIEWLETHLVEDFKGAVLLVTHDRYVLDAIADRIFELEHGRLSEFQGGYADYLEQKAELISHAGRVEQNRLNLLRRERAWLLRGAKARTTKQKARVDRARALTAVEVPKAAQSARLQGLEAGASRTGKTILELSDLELRLGGRRLIDGLTLRLVSGDRVGIVGRNGMGKTSLLKLVTGELTPTQGTIVLGQRTRLTLFDQTRAQLRDDWSVFDNVAEREGAERSGAGSVQIGEKTYELRTYLEQFLFDSKKQRQKLSALSGGERARVALAKALKSGANLLLLDEPTNDLDIATLGELEQMLEAWPGCALVVSHDRYFLDKVATSILAFEDNGHVVQYPGGYETYRSLRAQAEAQRSAELPLGSPAASAPSAALPASKARASSKPLTYAERLELGGLLDRVSEKEAELKRLESKLSDPALYSEQILDAKGLKHDYELAVSELEQLTSRWEELEVRRDIRR